MNKLPSKIHVMKKYWITANFLNTCLNESEEFGKIRTKTIWIITSINVM